MDAGARARSVWLQKRPALSLFGVAFVLGFLPILFVQAGWLPTSFSQLGALSASAAGFLLAALESGRSGVVELLRRGAVWRVGIGWWLTAIGYTAIIAVAALLLASMIDPAIELAWDKLRPLVEVVPMMVVLIVLAGLGEEFGWRGYLLPRLQRRLSALRASLVIGGFHSLWHVPLFFVDGTVQQTWADEIGLVWAFLGYSLFVVAWAVQLTWFFNQSGGSVLMVAVVHGAGNAWIGGYLDISGQAGVLGNLSLAVLMAVVSIAVVVFAGPTHLSRKRVRNTLASS